MVLHLRFCSLMEAMLPACLKLPQMKEACMQLTVSCDIAFQMEPGLSIAVLLNPRIGLHRDMQKHGWKIEPCSLSETLREAKYD